MGKLAVKIVVIVLIVAILAVAGYFGQKFVREKYFQKSEVGIIDKDEIFKMSAFKKAENNVQKKIMELQQKFAQESKGLSPEKAKELSQLYEQQIEKTKADELKPLLDKAQAAVALVAKEKQLKVVLDKKIVVCGAEEITDLVKDKFKESDTLEAPKDDVGTESQIGYFDQEVVRSLKLFRDVDKQFMEWYAKLKKEAEQKIKAAGSDEERQKLFAQYNQVYKAQQDQIYVPVLNKVTKTVEKVAKEKELILVLDKQYVMYGGRNITDEVADKLK